MNFFEKIAKKRQKLSVESDMYADTDADTDMTLFGIADTDMTGFEIAETDTDIHFLEIFGHGHEATLILINIFTDLVSFACKFDDNVLVTGKDKVHKLTFHALKIISPSQLFFKVLIKLIGF